MDKFKKDLVRKPLIPIKILMFLIYGGQATLYPFFTVHLQSLEVSIRQIAIIFAVQPVIALFVVPMVGMMADKIGNFKLIFSFFLVFSAITANLLLLVPRVTQREKFLFFNLKCHSSSETVIEIDQSASCQINRDINDSYSKMAVKFQCNSCPDMDEYFFPLTLDNDHDCSQQCSSDKGGDCINETTVLDFSLNIGNLTENSTIISEDLYEIHYKNITYNALQCSCTKCNTSCMFVSQSPVKECFDFPPNDNFGETFWTYLAIRLFVTLGIGLVNGLFDAASMTIIKDLKADVGFQRFWSTVAMCIFAPISGHLKDVFNSFMPCFFMYGCLYLIAAVTSMKLDLSMKLPTDNSIKDLAKLLKNPEVILLLIHIAVLGICWGFLENFLFLFLEDELNSNNLIMGLTVTVGSGTGLFMALTSTWCTRKMGYVNVIIVAFAAYTVRFLGYAYAMDAYTCLIFEMMENFTVTLLTVGVTLYCTELASMEMLTTIMTLWNGLHIISGRAFGTLLGGFLVTNYGYRETFHYFAYISTSFGVFYALVYIIWLRKWRKMQRKESIASRKGSLLTEEREDEALKNEAFSSLALHIGSDSSVIFHHVPDSPEIKFRRRAVSHTPIRRSSSPQQPWSISRHAMSFSVQKKAQPTLSAILESPPVLDNSGFHFQIIPGEETSKETDLVTKL